MATEKVDKFNQSVNQIIDSHTIIMKEVCAFDIDFQQNELAKVICDFCIESKQSIFTPREVQELAGELLDVVNKQCSMELDYYSRTLTKNYCDFANGARNGDDQLFLQGIKGYKEMDLSALHSPTQSNLEKAAQLLNNVSNQIKSEELKSKLSHILLLIDKRKGLMEKIRGLDSSLIRDPLHTLEKIIDSYRT